MLKPRYIVFTISLLSIALLTACGTSAYVGKYTNDKSHYILLNADGTFEADNYIKLTGKYRVKGEEVEFTVLTMDGKSMNNKAKGSLKGDKLKGPDTFEYTKEKVDTK